MTDGSESPIGKDGLPKHWSDWSKGYFKRLASSDFQDDFLDSDDQPEWVDELWLKFGEFGYSSIRSIRQKKLAVSGEAFLGAYIGDLVRLGDFEEHFSSAVHQLDEFNEKNIQAKRMKLSGKKLADFDKEMRKRKRERKEQQASLSEEMLRQFGILDEVFASASERPVQDQIEFFEAYLNALKNEIFTEDGHYIHEKSSSNSAIRALLLLCWQQVAQMRNLQDVYRWLQSSLGKDQVPEFDTVRKEMDRLGLKLAKPGRPKKPE